MMDFKNHIDNTKSKNSEWFLERDVNVSRRHKFIYMKPAKTAGTSIYRHWLKGLNAKDIFNRKDDPLEYMDWWKNTSNETMMTEYFKFVFVRNVSTSFAPLKFAFSKLAPRRSASNRFVREKFTSLKSCPVRSTFVRSASEKFTPVRSVSVNSTFTSSAPEKFAPERTAAEFSNLVTSGGGAKAYSL